MKIESLKDLKKVIQLCRETGVDIIKVDGIELVLGSQPVPINKSLGKNLVTSLKEANAFHTAMGPDVPIETPDALTDEELLFYSAQGSTGEI